MKKLLLATFLLFSACIPAQTQLTLGRIDTIWATGKVPLGLNQTNTWFSLANYWQTHGGGGTTGYIPKWNTSTTFTASPFFVGSNGFIGMGTTSPAYDFQISRSSSSATAFPNVVVINTSITQGNGTSTFNFADFSMAAGNGAVGGFIYASYTNGGGLIPSVGLVSSTNHPLIFGINYAGSPIVPMSIATSGNVGIGTNAYLASAAAKLEIQGSSGSTLRILDGNQAAGYVWTCASTTGQGSWAAGGGSGTIQGSGTPGYIPLFITNSVTISNSEIQDNGAGIVSIGVSTPSSLLGTLRLNDATNTGNPLQLYGPLGGSFVSWHNQADGTYKFFNNLASNSDLIYVNYNGSFNEVMRLSNSTGDVSIGNGVPTQKMEVGGSLNIDGGVLYMKDTMTPFHYWSGAIVSGVLVWTDTGSATKP